MSPTPASCNKRLTAGEATRPVPRGAGINCFSCVSLAVYVVFSMRVICAQLCRQYIVNEIHIPEQ